MLNILGVSNSDNAIPIIVLHKGPETINLPARRRIKRIVVHDHSLMPLLLLTRLRNRIDNLNKVISFFVQAETF